MGDMREDMRALRQSLRREVKRNRKDDIEFIEILAGRGVIDATAFNSGYHWRLRNPETGVQVDYFPGRGKIARGHRRVDGNGLYDALAAIGVKVEDL